MKFGNRSLIFITLFLMTQIVFAEESEKQLLSEEQENMETQTVSKELGASEQEDTGMQTVSQEQEFLARGLGTKHYQKAQRLNLDLENYTNYCANKSNKIKGAIIMGVGGAFVAEGLVCFLCGALMESVGNQDPYDYYDNDDEIKDVTKKVYMITGGISCAAGSILMAAGGVKLSKKLEVFRKDGTKLSLKPSIDFLKNAYKAEVSLLF